MITKDIKLSNDIDLTLKSLTLDDLAENNEVVDLLIEAMSIFENSKSDGKVIVEELIKIAPDLCYLFIHLSIVNESEAEDYMTVNHIKTLFNLQDQLTLLNESVSLTVNDYDKLLKQKQKVVETSQKLNNLMSRLYKK